LKSPGNTQEKPGLSPRDRILAAASDLFYARGIRAVSVDEIADAAQTNKMTLYRHFQSKDLLIAEYVRALAAEADAVWPELAHDYPGDPMAQLKAWVDFIADKLGGPGARGCAVANAAVEIAEKDHPARAIIEAHKTHQRENLAQVCRAAGLVDSEQLADELFLLAEGARINLQSVGAGGPGARFRDMALALVDARSRTSEKANASETRRS
jgi:AcrR family transcriptional regulator